MGVFEMKAFSCGTFAMAKSIESCDATTVVAGRDTASAVYMSGANSKMSHISTGGAAFLEMLEGRILPGVKALDIK